MKTKKSKIALLLLLIIGAVAVLLKFLPTKSSNESPETQIEVEKEEKKDVEVIKIDAPVENKNLSYQGQIIPKEILAVKMKIAGTVKKGSKILKTGTSFKKGDILIELERVEVLYTLLATRTSFKALVKDALQDIQEKLPSEFEKWVRFEAQIQRTELLPSFPPISGDEELQLLMELDILSAYRKVQKTEEKAEDHFYLAPYDGFIVSSNIHSEKKIEADKELLTIAKQHSLIVSTTMNKEEAENLKNYKTFVFTNASNDTIGTGKLLELKEIKSNDLVEVNFSLSPQRANFIEEKINISIPKDKSTVTIPVSSLYNDSIYISKNEVYVETAVEIISRTQDSIKVINDFGPCIILKHGKDSQ